MNPRIYISDKKIHVESTLTSLPRGRHYVPVAISNSPPRQPAVAPIPLAGLSLCGAFMSENIIVGIFAGLFGIALEATRQWMTHGNVSQTKTLEDTTSFRQELRAEATRLREERDLWQSKFHEERGKRLKAEWQLEVLEWLRKEGIGELTKDHGDGGAS